MTELECLEEILLGDKRSVAFRARGTSMYPAIFSDDLVVVEPLPLTFQLEDHEIVLTRSQGRYMLCKYLEISGQDGSSLQDWSLPHSVPLARVVRVKKTWRSRLKRMFYRVYRTFHRINCLL